MVQSPDSTGTETRGDRVKTTLSRCCGVGYRLCQKSSCISVANREVETKTKTHAVGSFEQSCVQHYLVVTSIVDQVHQPFIHLHPRSGRLGINPTVVLYRNSIGIGHSTACRVHHEPRRSETAQTADVLNSSPDSYQCVISAYLSYSHEPVCRTATSPATRATRPCCCALQTHVSGLVPYLQLSVCHAREARREVWI